MAAGGTHGVSRIYASSGPRPTTSNDSFSAIPYHLLIVPVFPAGSFVLLLRIGTNRLQLRGRGLRGIFRSRLTLHATGSIRHDIVYRLT